jgi:cob(I)alamin adenosyltransferase
LEVETVTTDAKKVRAKRYETAFRRLGVLQWINRVTDIFFFAAVTVERMPGETDPCSNL